MTRFSLRVGLPLLAGVVITGCFSSGTVTRMANGRTIEGRFVGDEAYSAYLRGVVLEAEGRPSEASAAYRDGLRHDPKSPELWTRLGAMRCAISPREAGVFNPLNQALRLDATYEETWTERSRCHLRRDETADAYLAARRAVELDPNRTAPVLALTAVLERQGKTADAARWLDGLAIREPSIEGYQAMAALAARTGDASRRAAAEMALAQLRPSARSDRTVVTGVTGVTGVTKPSLEDVDRALLAGDMARARELSARVQLTAGSLALRAAALERATFAHQEASVVVEADPSNTDARVAAAVAADLAHDDAALFGALSGLPNTLDPLSPLASLLMGELLGRR